MADDGADKSNQEETPDQLAAKRRQWASYFLVALLLLLVGVSFAILGGGNNERHDHWTTDRGEHGNETVAENLDKHQISNQDREMEQEALRKPSGEFEFRNDVHQPVGFAPDDTFPIISHGMFPSKGDIWNDLLQMGKPNEYDRSDPPFWGKGVVSIFVRFKVLGLISVNTKTNSFELDLALGERWVDDRLKFDPTKLGSLAVIILSSTDEALHGGTGPIWRPDTYFMNAVRFSATGDEIGQHTEITPKGIVFWGRKIAATFVAQFHFQYFPFDKHRLPIARSDYRYHNKQVRVSWDGPHAATISEEVTHPLFQISAFDRAKVVKQFYLGPYDCVIMNIRIERSVMSYFVKSILPVYLIVLLGCLAYRIDVHEPKMVPARVGVIISCVLTQSSFGRQLTEFGPKVSYLTWMDFYVLVAFMFNAFAMLEMGYVLLSNMNQIKMPDGMHESNYIDNLMEIWVPILFTIFTAIMLMVGNWG